MANKTNKNYPEIDNIRDDLDSLKSNTVELAKHVRDDAAEQTHEMRKNAAVKLEHLVEAGKGSLSKFEEHAREKPLQTLAVAFIAGIAASILLGRR